MHPHELRSIAMRAGLACFLFAAVAGADATAAPSADQLSYLLGLQYGEHLRSFGLGDDTPLEPMTRGLKDGMHGKRLSAAEHMQLQTYTRNAMMGMVKHNQDAAKEFLQRNGKEKGVVTTASGLEYRIIAAGDRKAAAIAPSDEVTVQYRGKLLDGSEFDSSYSRGMPATFRVNGVIRGWQEALVLMKPGAKWQLFIPPELAYGFDQRPGIPPGSMLIFDVELVSVAANAAAPSNPQPPAKSAAPSK